MPTLPGAFGILISENRGTQNPNRKGDNDMKKKSKKSNKGSHYNGRNVFGERCIAKFVTLEKATAVEQYLEILADIDNHPGDIIEYTFTLSKDFSHSEAEALYKWIDKVSAFHAMAQKKNFTRMDIRCAGPIPSFV